MITASVVAFHTSLDDLERLILCVLKSSISKVYIVDNASEGVIRNFSSKYSILVSSQKKAID